MESISVTVFVPIIVGNTRRAVLLPWPGYDDDFRIVVFRNCRRWLVDGMHPVSATISCRGVASERPVHSRYRTPEREHIRTTPIALGEYL
ncbi:hypothetical protein B0G62_108199 [Paraburkholderia eburnea]|uniref:Uncharacterized protein n=1 Tax=Paraburkholderia eburnea TaxID=1189126 RepID=A0A2S4M856_9BURK|nr:hypothetical protein B0G62_108199 [Paraburkholderia eburnea]PRZ21475.1 hypothetical protein BX588_109199 [Paraburkholderia eburnea]